jgi:hypothetical protein
MAGGGAKPGERFGGRVAGTLNMATQEVIERERIEAQLEAPVTAETAQAAAAVAPDMVRAVVGHRKLAKERLEELLEIFLGAAAYHQPTIDPGAAPNENASWDGFEKWSRLAMDCAALAAKYQSPQFRAIMVAPAPDANQPERRKRFTLTIFETPRPQLATPQQETPFTEAETIPPDDGTQE